MKTRLILSVMLLVVSAFVSQAQHYRTNGMPDMRYSENRSTYGTSYSTPTTTSLPAVRYQSGYQRSDGTSVSSHYKTFSASTLLEAARIMSSIKTQDLKFESFKQDPPAKE